MSLSKRVRFEVFKRDLFTCQYCGRRPPDVVLEVDHVIARAEGGSDDPDNLCTSCFDCNRGKADKGLGEVQPAVDELARLEAMQEMAERARLAQQQADAVAAKREAEQQSIDLVREWWRGIGGGDGAEFMESSIRTFLRRLTLDEILEAIHATERHWDRHPKTKVGDAWKYFCGCCWRLIKGDQ